MFGVIGAGWHLHPANELPCLGEVAAPVLRGVLSCKPVRSQLRGDALALRAAVRDVSCAVGSLAVLGEGSVGRDTFCAMGSQAAVGNGAMGKNHILCSGFPATSSCWGKGLQGGLHPKPWGSQMAPGKRVHGEGHVLLGSQPMVDPVTALTSASPRAWPVSLGMASPAVATHTGHPCRGSAGSRRPGEFQGALQGREVLGDRGHHRQGCQGRSHPSVDPPATSSRRERRGWLPTEQL